MFELGEQLGRPVVEFGLGLSHQQPDAVILAIEINHPRSATLALARAAPAHLATAARPRNHITSQRVFRNPADESRVLGFRALR